MKKLTTVLLTLSFVFGVAAMSSAAAFNCAGEAGNIARGCSTTQDQACAPFNFENPNDYCNSKTPNRAVFKICDCLLVDHVFSSITAGDTFDVSMEILVDNGSSDGPVAGDNGVYWAENVDASGIGLGLYNDQSTVCADYAYGTYFAGPFNYWTADGKLGTVNTGAVCDIPDTNRVVKITADRAAAAQAGHTTGYTVTQNDTFNYSSEWAINIPAMRVDNNKVNAGDKVWVKVCLSLYSGDICQALPCCYDIYIGQLCCPGDTAPGAQSLVYPYFPPANSTAFNLIGMTITNLTATAGSAVITMYESDGTVGTVTVNVPANGIYLSTLGSLVADPNMVKTGPGTLGDSMSYIVVKPTFSAAGFVMIADTIDGASMGYLAK